MLEMHTNSKNDISSGPEKKKKNIYIYIYIRTAALVV